MNKNIKAVVLDFDDTMYSHKMEEVPGLTRRALKELKGNGYIIGMCTSRFPSEFSRFPTSMLDQFDAAIEGTGGLVIQQEKITHMDLLNHDTVVQFTTYMDNHNITYQWITSELEEHFNKEPIMKVKMHIFNWRGKLPTIQKWNGERLLNLMFYDADETEMEHLCNMSKDVSVQRWRTSGQINAKGVDKAYGVREFARLFHIKPEEVAAFGDGGNDVSMLDQAGIGIAVGDASQVLKDRADVITDSIEEGGIFNACVEQGWIEDHEGIKIIFFDIDGTTYQNNIKDNPKSTMTALKKLRDQGIRLAIDTSRADAEMCHLPKKFLSSMDAIISCGGGKIQMDGKDYYRYLDQEHVKNGIEYLEKNHIVYRWVDGHGHCYLNRHVKEVDEIFDRLYSMIPEAHAYNGEKLVHLLYYTSDGEQLKQIEKLFPTEHHTHLGYANEINAHAISKAASMRITASHYGYSSLNIAAFGDGYNDVEMLQAAQVGIAMGNAKQACKAAADYVTDSIENDGMYNACIHFGWIKSDHKQGDK